VIAAAAWAVLIVIYAGRAVVDPASVTRHLRDPVLVPFFSLAALVGMLLAVGLEDASRTAGIVLFMASLAAATLFGGWTMGSLLCGFRSCSSTSCPRCLWLQSPLVVVPAQERLWSPLPERGTRSQRQRSRLPAREL
jgi:tellurite resistance protein TehA-like permease